MKNKRIYLYLSLIFMVALLIYIPVKFIGIGASKPQEETKEKKTVIKKNTQKETKIEKNNFVSYNGELKIKDNTLVNQYDEKIQLKGISSHGIQWFSDLANEENIKILKEEWGTNLFRIAMYTKEGGYIDNNAIKEKVYEIADIVIKNDMYVIIDWHILSDNNPMTYKEESKKFFEEVSNKYKNTPNVIFEICNEPNGSTSWDNDIKPYAEEVINVIRKNSDNIIIVGTPTWSQEVDKPANNKINDDKVMYALHFYAGTHTEWLRDRTREALKNIPIFVSEWGVSDASGNGGIYLDEAEKWINFMNGNNLSWANWSLANKDESSALLLPGKNQINDSNLSESGKYVKSLVK